MARGFAGSKTKKEFRDRTRTPLWLFHAINAEFDFCLDAAALPETALCEKYITPEVNTLAVEWGDFISPLIRTPFVWMNPPYSDPAPFIEKCIKEQQKGIGSVVLIPEDSSAKWWPADACSEVRRIIGYIGEDGKWHSGRIAFINAETGEEMKCNNKGSNLLIFRPRYTGPCITSHVSKGKLLEIGNKIIESINADEKLRYAKCA